MEIEYEADKYSHIQDKRAMKMFKIEGFANTETSSNLTDELFSCGGDCSENSDNIEVNNYMFINHPNLDQESLGLIMQDVMDEDDGHIYFKALVDVLGEDLGDGNSTFEYVKGYAKILSHGLHINYSSNNLFWIEFEETVTGCKKEKPTHPIALTSINFAKLYMMSMLRGSDCDNLLDDLDFSDPLIFLDIVEQVKSDYSKNYLFRCFNNWLIDRDGCQKIDLNQSFVRLYSDTEKYGGGHRVKKITMSDQWSDMTDGQETESFYGKEYIYQGGVASYEPLVGGDENPFRQPVTYTEDTDLNLLGGKLKFQMAPSQEHLQELPIGEIHFPSPLVVYSTVIERNISKEKVKKNATGSTEYQHYTARDFPLISNYTTADIQIDKTPLSLKSLVNTYQTTSASQGFRIQKNDMHGKLNSVGYYRGA
jgi:hypothetical protein